MPRTAIILASARSNGDTRKIVDSLMQLDDTMDCIDLKDYDIGYFDYENKHADDDFIPLIKRLIRYENFVFATPIYWYSMSAQLKTFMDRFTDLLFTEKALGRALKGKNLYVISCSAGYTAGKGFYTPFRLFATYLDMHYGAALSIRMKNPGVGPINTVTAKRIARFASAIATQCA